MKKLFFRLLCFSTGLAILSFGYTLIMHAGLGSDSFGMLIQGISIKTGITIGRGSQLINLTVVLIVLVWNRKLTGVGTFIIMFGLGLFMDLYLSVLPVGVPLAVNVLFLAVGIIAAGFGIALTIISDMGASPVDCLMLLLSTKLNASIATVRIIMEITIALAGWLLGGTAGLGTILASLFIGPAINTSLKAFKKVK